MIATARKSRTALAPVRALLRALGQHRTAALVGAFGYGDTHHYWQLVEAQLDYRARFLAALDSGDGGPFHAVLGPACALPAFIHGASREMGIPGTYSTLPNVLGFPAGTVPVTRVRAGEESDRAPSRDVVDRTASAVERGSTGLPVGVQIMARPWRDDVALAALRAIETGAKYGQEPT
jgi:fatty acid amide hydrolase